MADVNTKQTEMEKLIVLKEYAARFGRDYIPTGLSGTFGRELLEQASRLLDRMRVLTDELLAGAE